MLFNNVLELVAACRSVNPEPSAPLPLPREQIVRCKILCGPRQMMAEMDLNRGDFWEDSQMVPMYRRFYNTLEFIDGKDEWLSQNGVMAEAL